MHTRTLSEAEFKTIIDDVEREFPHDPALQQIHIARQILVSEAKNNGIGLLEYASSIAKKIKRFEPH